MSSQSLTGFSYLTASLILSSVNDLIIKSMGSHLPGSQLSFLRFASAALMVWAWARLKKHSLLGTSSIIDVIRGVFLFLGMTLWSQCLHQVPLAQAVLMNFTIPFFQLFLGALILKERLLSGHILATICGFIGVFVSCSDLSFDFAFVPRLLLASSLFATCDLLNKISTRQQDQLSTLFYTAMFTAGIGFIPALTVWKLPAMSDWVGLIALGISSNVLFALLLQGLSRLTLVQAAPFRYMELVLSSFLAYAFFAEVPSIEVGLAALFIVPSALWVVLQQDSNDAVAVA